MRARAPLLVAAAAVLALGAGTVAQTSAPKAEAAQRDWTRMVAETAEGGFRMGNPRAPVRLIEYGSLTCGHCAAFVREGVPALIRDHVRTGRVSFEFRNFVLNPYDMAAALVSRCGGARSFFGTTEALYANQEQWVERFSAMTREQAEAMNTLPESERFGRLAEIGGLASYAAKSGITPDQARVCAVDPQGIAKLVEMRRAAAAAHQVQGTPTFVVNGAKVAANDWATLEPLLRPAS